MKDNEFNELKQNFLNIINNGFYELIKGHRDDDQYLYSLKNSVDDTINNKYDWNMEKAQIIFAVLQLKSSSDIKPKIPANYTQVI